MAPTLTAFAAPRGGSFLTGGPGSEIFPVTGAVGTCTSRLRCARAWGLVLVLAAAGSVAHAGLFDDEEARKAILDLRERLAQVSDVARTNEAAAKTTAEQLSTLRHSVLELNTQIEQMRTEVAHLRGSNEQALRDVSDVQKAQKDANQAFDERLRKIEPQKVSVDGHEFDAGADEKRAYEAAVGTLRTGDFDKSVAALTAFQARYPKSGYASSVRFWLGNALYGKRDYKAAMAEFRAVIDDAPDNPKAPEAMLALANIQAETKDTAAARKTLDGLMKSYPQSEAAAAAKDRRASLK